MDSNPSLRSADFTSMPSANTNVRLNWRAAMPRWMYCRDLSSSWRPRMLSWLSSTVISIWSRLKPATASVMRSSSAVPGCRSVAPRRRCARCCRGDSRRRRPCRRGRSAVPCPQSPAAAGSTAVTCASSAKPSSKRPWPEHPRLLRTRRGLRRPSPVAGAGCVRRQDMVLSGATSRNGPGTARARMAAQAGDWATLALILAGALAGGFVNGLTGFGTALTGPAAVAAGGGAAGCGPAGLGLLRCSAT